MDVRVFDTPDALAEAAADALADLLRRTPGGFGLAGGSTPRAAYGKLIERDIPWPDVTCWLPDERWVPPMDPDANARMARRELTDHVAARFLAPDTTIDDPHVAASAYEQDLNGEFGGEVGIVLLGIGADGHTASLFPHSDALAVDDQFAVATTAPDGSPRITVTAPVINAARRVWFLVSGSAKAGMVAEVIEGLRLPIAVPAQGVAPVHGTLTWFLDDAAAAELSPDAKA